jgi:hypothetical protein
LVLYEIIEASLRGNFLFMITEEALPPLYKKKKLCHHCRVPAIRNTIASPKHCCLFCVFEDLGERFQRTERSYRSFFFGTARPNPGVPTWQDKTLWTRGTATGVRGLVVRRRDSNDERWTPQFGYGYSIRYLIRYRISVGYLI